MPGHEIFYHRSESTSLTYSGQELKIRENDVGGGYGIRVLSDGRIGFAYCQEEAGIKDAIEKAEKLSRFSVQSPFSFSPETSFSSPEIFNEKLSPDDYEMLSSVVKQTRDAAESHGGQSRVIAEMASSETRLENTAGFEGSYRSSEISVYAETMDADGFGLSYFVSNLKLPDGVALGMEAAEMAKSMQSAKKPESGTYTVVLELEALGSLLETALPSFSGDWKRRSISRLKEGEESFSEMLSVFDDPLEKGSETRPFDDEGTASKRKPLVLEGKVASFLYDHENAALEGVKDGGNCIRSSYASPPAIGSSNIAISPGDWKSLDELGSYLEIHHMHGSHTSNPTSGDIGMEVNTAFLVENGKRTPVKGFMITGNVFDILANIEAMERNVRVFDYLVAPRIAFRDIKAVS
ncbi:hypothetical protein GF318_05555 [Candidatus Micrarchaeota archaeon]|nr:hypothetical protein [Candidatus Micrarchaeota archaeon]